jgi:hypothetical protein
MSKLFSKIKKISGNENAFTLGDENPYEVSEWVNTNSFALNAVLSDGDIFKGLPKGKRVMISGEPSTAKSLFTIFLIKNYLDKVDDSYVIFFETEGSSTVKTAKEIGISEDRMIILPVNTIEECRTQYVRILDEIIEHNKKNPDAQEHPIMCLDSIGMLSTNKEMGDIADGKDTRDMTRSQLLRGFARAVTLKIALAQTPSIFVNHTYQTMSQYESDKVSGGGGPSYMVDISLILKKSKEKDSSKKQVGVKIKTIVEKSRYMQEQKSVEVILHFKKGLYPYSSLFDLTKTLEIFPREGNSFIMPDGEKVAMKDFQKNIAKYFKEDEEIRKAIRNGIMDDFSFGSLANSVDDSDDMDESESVEETD